MVVALVLAAVSPALLSVEIWLFKIVVDDVLIPRDFGLFPLVAATYVGLTLVQALCDGADRLLSTWLSQRFLVDVRTALLDHLQRLPQEFLSRNRLGDVMSRVSGDVSAIECFLVSGTSRAVSTSWSWSSSPSRCSLLQPAAGAGGARGDPAVLGHLALLRAPAQGARPRAAAPLGQPQHLARADPQHPAAGAGLRPGRARGPALRHRGGGQVPRGDGVGPPAGDLRPDPRLHRARSAPWSSSARAPGCCPRTA